MGRGRPPKGLSHVDGLEGDAEEKARLKTILATLTGDLTVKEAGERLGVSESRFHDLRQQALEGMMVGLAPRPPGRPAKEREPEEMRALRERVAHLEEELEVSRLRTEIAMWKPSLLRDPSSDSKKKGSTSSRPGRRERRRKPGGRSGT